MKKRNIFYVLLTGISAAVFINYSPLNNGTTSTQHLVTNKTIDTNLPTHKELANEPPPIEHDYNISTEDFIKARKEARAMRAALKAKEINSQSTYRSKTKTETQYSLPPHTTAVPHWQFKGPKTFGRITAIVADPENPDKVYVGTPQGGVWKSTDGGTHYRPIFDHAGSLSIGALALDPHDSDIIYVGTGDCDRLRESSFNGYGVQPYNTLGDGIWKSTDGGQTWERLGLENQYRIASIVINPNNSMEIFAVSYDVHADTNRNGIFRSRDGGQTWRHIFKSDNNHRQTRNMQMDPNNSRRLYTSTPLGIWKSEDSGDTWRKLTNGLPSTNSSSNVIFSLAPSSPNRLYVSIIPSGQLYRSNDYGETWESS